MSVPVHVARHRVGIAAALAVVSGVLVIAGCGSSSKPSSPGNRASNLAAAGISFSSCMRSHGVSGFPDPTTTPPSNPAGYSGVVTDNGVSFVIPTTIDIQSPAVKQASTACHLAGLGQGG